MSYSPAYLAALEARVAALEQQIGGGQPSEASVPNYLTYNPATGAVGANFTGVINALGLVLPAGVIDPAPPSSSIEWQNADGFVIAKLQAYDLGTATLELDVSADTGQGDTASQFLVAAGATQFVVIDSHGRSTLLANAEGVQQLAFDYGSQSISTGAGGNGSATISHAIGRTPVVVIAGVGNNNFTVSAPHGAGNRSSNTLTLNVVGTPSNSVTVDWFALG